MGTWHLSRPLNETSEQALQQPGGKGSQQKEQVVKHLRLSCVGGTRAAGTRRAGECDLGGSRRQGQILEHLEVTI